MKNKEIYFKDPSSRKLVNEGVANVNDDSTDKAMDVLRYELETFVCDGQYQKGMELILETYLKNINQAQQPGVWISGFYGSGKSHLAKMLRALWMDTRFEDGARARGISSLPQNIKELFKELSTAGKRHGGLHAASGTLGSGASGSVRLALLGIIFKSAGLPEQYAAARFVMWLKSEGIFDAVKDRVEKSGSDWQEELDNFYVAEALHEALTKVKPKLFSSASTCTDTLNNSYPYVQDISNDEMVKAIKSALSKGGVFPLTAVILDEVQQYIGGSGERSMLVQEVVESCCKNIGGKLLFIGTGQTAVTGTANLKKLEGRFTVRVELSDADVDAVIRKVILAKNATAVSAINKSMEKNLGEVSRHLADTTIGHRQEDVPFFSQDYPILPVRRRFWENALRVLDPTGTDSQLRNQLTMIHKAIQSNLDVPLGNVIEGDYIYFDSADRLLQGRVIPRKLYEKTMRWIKGGHEDQLRARACGAVFLINKLAGSNNDIGIKATVDTVADLLVQDLPKGSAALRSKLPKLMDQRDLLMKVGDEYRIQTEESAAWNDDFVSQKNRLANEAHRLEAERDDRIRMKFGQVVKKLALLHGKSKVKRDVHPIFNAQLPSDSNQKLCLWIRDGWNNDEKSVQVEAKAAGSQSPTVFVFIPKRCADDLRHNFIVYKAAAATLDKRGTPNSAEGTEARAFMETMKQTADGKINELLEDAFSGARVFQGGGNEIIDNDLAKMVSQAATNSLARLFPKFDMADHPGWSKVYEKARKGAPDALKNIGDQGEPANNAVCKAVLSFVGSGQKGADIRGYFTGAPHGWPQDAVDGALQVLLLSGLLKAAGDRGAAADPKALERKAVGKTMFKAEAVTITTARRIQIRKLFQKTGLSVKNGEESTTAAQFFEKLRDLAGHAGGDPPKPERPDTAMLEEIRLKSGNDQLLAIYEQREDLAQFITDWTKLGEQIEKRWPDWHLLKQLLNHSEGLEDMDEATAQAAHIEENRLLIEDQNPVDQLLVDTTQRLREELHRLGKEYQERHAQGMARIEDDPIWRKLSLEQKNAILAGHGLNPEAAPAIDTSGRGEILATLERTPLSTLADRVAVLESRFNSAVVAAVEMISPKARVVKLPGRTINSEQEIDSWLGDVKSIIKKALKEGPAIIQ